MLTELILVVIILLILSLTIITGFASLFLIKKVKVLVEIGRWWNGLQPILLLVFLVIFLVSVVYFTLFYSNKFLPHPPAPVQEEIEPLFNTTVILTGFTFFITQILLFFFPFKYQWDPSRKVKFLKNNLKLEISWVIIPALTFIFLFVWGQILWAKMISPPEEDELMIDVMGEQFSWRARYGGKDGKLGNWEFTLIDEINDMGIDFTDSASRDDFMPVQMHIPKGQKVRLYLRSRDVIHSFYIPFMRIKMDALPGMVSTVSFTATKTTEEMRDELNDPDFQYEVACAELCGRMHFTMKKILVVDEPEEYRQWVEEQKTWLQDHQDYKVEL
jgi:cytochrome c oxidase subunit 2